MLIQAAVPVIVCILGVLVYALSANPKSSEMGRLAFFAGLFVALLVVAEHIVRLT